MTVRILIGDVRARLAELPDASVHMVCTSPPYYGLRDYGVACQIGLEETPQAYIETMVAVFREVRRVLRADDACVTLPFRAINSGAGDGQRISGEGPALTSTGPVPPHPAFGRVLGVSFAPAILSALSRRLAWKRQAETMHARRKRHVD